jgi:hypothetical protein
MFLVLELEMMLALSYTQPITAIQNATAFPLFMAFVHPNRDGGDTVRTLC